MSESSSQFFAPAPNGDSLPIYKALVENLELLQSPQIKARNRQFKNLPSSSLMIDGMPGIPFERGISNPDLFYQGEDVVYDLFLFHEGKPIESQDYDILVGVKTSPRAYTFTYEATIDSGLYPIKENPGYYELWIPADLTKTWMAGSYYLDVLLKESVAHGKGRYDRKYLILQTNFNIEYCNYSPSPETKAQNPDRVTRANIEETWPNTPNTVNRHPVVPDAFYTPE